MVIRELLKKLEGNEGLIFLEYLWDKPRSYILQRLHDPASTELIQLIEEAQRKRRSGMPLQYIIGKWNFYGRNFKVDSRALIPRPETELLVEQALERIQPGEEALDLCTGTGIIALTLGLERPDIHVTGTDISEDALDLAKENRELLGAHHIELLRGDLWEPFENTGRTFDVILSNPPYISPEEYRTLEEELYYEPESALLAREKGMEFYNRIIKDIRKYLRPGGRILFEIGHDQGNLVVEQLIRQGFQNTTITKDYNGLDRIVQGDIE